LLSCEATTAIPANPSPAPFPGWLESFLSSGFTGVFEAGLAA
jgi:hypothetical protein